MKRFKNSIFYLAVIGGFSALTYCIFRWGVQLQQGRDIAVTKAGKNKWADFTDSLVGNSAHPWHCCWHK
jgi:hypothetical protein